MKNIKDSKRCVDPSRLKKVREGYHNPPLAPASPTLWLEWPVTQLTRRKWFSSSKHVRRPRLSYCELQNPIPSFGFSELVVPQVGSFLAKQFSSAARSFRKSSGTNPKWIQMVSRGSCISCILVQIHCSALSPISKLFCSTGLQTWLKQTSCCGLSTYCDIAPSNGACAICIVCEGVIIDTSDCTVVPPKKICSSQRR